VPLRGTSGKLVCRYTALEAFQMVKLGTSFLNSLEEELKEVGVKNLCEIEEGKYALSIRVGGGVVSLLFDVSNIGEVEIYDPEGCLGGKRIKYVSLLEALSLILNHKKD